MDKKIIRLTESDLHRIVKESVNKVLTEMDWKTYRSAGDKAAQRGDKDRASDFYNYSNRKLEDEYGLHNKGEKEGTFINSDDGAYTEEGNFIPFGKFRHTPTTYIDNGEPFDERKLGDRVYGEPKDWDERGFEKVSPKQSAKINKAMGDMRAFDDGAYEYGTYKHYPFNRGWHRKGMIKQ
jgi:hypothetical protein